jgi:hypothetical protein
VEEEGEGRVLPLSLNGSFGLVNFADAGEEEEEEAVDPVLVAAVAVKEVEAAATRPGLKERG